MLRRPCSRKTMEEHRRVIISVVGPAGLVGEEGGGGHHHRGGNFLLAVSAKETSSQDARAEAWVTSSFFTCPLTTTTFSSRSTHDGL